MDKPPCTALTAWPATRWFDAKHSSRLPVTRTSTESKVMDRAVYVVLSDDKQNQSDGHFAVIIFRIFWTDIISTFVMLLRVAKYFRP